MTDHSRFKKQIVSAAGAVATILSLGGPAFAQGTAADDQDGGIETVIVTANKKSEDAQKVPIAIAAITAEDAEKLGVVNGQTLAQVIPGLQLNRQTNGTTPFVRGVGTPSSQAGTEPGVAMYVDDVYYGSSAVALTNYNSISRIEVLKGPQGTLFGRNATGGVIQVFTKDPSDEKSVDVSLGYANYETPSGSIYATGKLSDNVAANIAVYAEDSSGGWGENFTTGNPSYTSHNYGARAKLRWNVGEATTVLFNVDYDDFANQQAVYFRPAPGTLSNAGATSTPPPGIYDTFENLDPRADAKQYGGSVKVTHDFSNDMRLVSISAYRNVEATQEFAQDGNITARLNPLLVYTADTYTQEFQVLSNPDADWSWVAGAFFLKDEVTVDPFLFSGTLAGGGLNRKGAFSTQETESYSAFFQTTIPLGDKAHVTAGIRYTNDERSLTGGRENIDATGNSLRTLAVNSGISDSWSNVTGRLAVDYQFTDDIMGYVGYNKGFKSGLFNTIIAPSFAPGTPAAPTIDPPVDPEEIDAITLGVKTQWFNDTLRLNAEAFHYDYKGLQLQQVILIPGGGTATRITNAAAATIKGFELDMVWQPTDQFSMNAGIQLLEGRYDDFPNGQFFVYRAVPGGNCAFTAGAIITATTIGGCAGGVVPPNYTGSRTVGQPTGNWNLKGNHTIQTPPFSYTLNGTYSIPMTSGASVDITAGLSYTGNYYADADNGLGQIAPSQQDNNKQLGYEIVNAAATWYSADDKYSVKLWGKNLGDTRYWSFANETGTVTKSIPAPPRTYGLTFTARF